MVVTGEEPMMMHSRGERLEIFSSQAYTKAGMATWFGHLYRKAILGMEAEEERFPKLDS
jgi:hypothetical protein